MARLKVKQLLSNLKYDTASSKLTVSGSGAGEDFVVSGSTVISPTSTKTGSLSIKGIDSFGDSGSFYTVDLGDY